ncbi:MAG: hypothetical protein QOG79_2541 [Mycobacterium sp.]|jgi:hypothetical protein|nr:hypothetical protein [Mycobacterium sp.]MDT5299299.1 hypothetical protein [Mycobacterium sp.]
MSNSTQQTEPALLDRYQAYRTRRFLKNERTYANALPGWRNQGRRRVLALQIVSGRQGDAPQETLDEFEVQQRNSARSIGLTVTQNLMLVPIGYLIIGSVLTRGTDVDMAYAGGLMALTVLMVGGCMPAMILGWTRSDPDPE